MSRMISRRSFLKCAGVSALAIGTAGVLGGCDSISNYFADMIDYYGTGSSYTFGTSLTATLTSATYMTMDERNYFGLTDEDEDYVWVVFEINNKTDEELDFYEGTWSESWNYGSLSTVISKLYSPTSSQKKLHDDVCVNKTQLNILGRYSSLYEYMNGRKGGYGYDAFYGAVVTYSEVTDIRYLSNYTAQTTLQANGTSYINCICGVYESGYFQTLRFIYSPAVEGTAEVNFVLKPLNGDISGTALT